MTTARDLPAPIAPRLRRPTWRDPRLLLGVVMVAGAVALGSWVLSAGDETVPVYVARHALAPGQPVGPESLGTARVRIVGDAERQYIRADETFPAGKVAIRVVGDGELLPRSALGDAQALDLRPVAVPVGTDLPTGLTVGSRVDVWFTPDTQDGPDGGPPRQVAAELVVAEVSRPSSGLGVRTEAVVQLLVTGEQLPDVLSALAGDGQVAVVLIPGASGELAS